MEYNLNSELTIPVLAQVAYRRAKVAWLPGPTKRFIESMKWVEHVSKGELKDGSGPEAKAYYGITNGFGGLAGKCALGIDQSCQLSRNIVLSHSIGAGPSLSREIVRAAMLVLARSLAQGFSGVRSCIVHALIDMLNNDVYPRIPMHGSLGASGDLAQLAHLAMCFTKPPTPSEDEDKETGFVFVDGKLEPSNPGSGMRGHPPTAVVLGPQEGLALTNGASFSAALCVGEGIEVANLSAECIAMGGFRDSMHWMVHPPRNDPCEFCLSGSYIENELPILHPKDRFILRNQYIFIYAFICSNFECDFVPEAQ